MPSLSSFRLRYPEFGAASDAVIQFWLDEVAGELNVTNFGDCFAAAVETLAAHEITLSSQRAAQVTGGNSLTVGTVQAASADGLSVTMALSKSATGSAREAYLSQTPYGLKYLSIRESCLSRGWAVSCQ